MDLLQAKKIMGRNFIGPEELNAISTKLGIVHLDSAKNSIPEVEFSEQDLKKASSDYILILGAAKARDGEKLTLNKMRAHFGWNPQKSEPCFYNQDWYLKESFADSIVLKNKWYLISKNVAEATRGKSADESDALPPAILTAFTFFAYYFLTGGEILWKNDFIWCSDKDSNGDRIYTGRYVDSNRINKNGFNVHRHLAIRQCYGTALVK